ncbi:clathrin assembly protein AP19, small subunit [Acanthamoeba castellanii str. Neff]|uniref:AP complex subunit sigma n=1 Tax=Acanthamoeba castellanii (strain ATCC 30010 / Neff) TaxID=1257118 RepID=L8GJT6_ACACF|nr:clathrin assembly protein AP19, small subunit [Acanthamoeba castellanii str. Neff]ELR13340.1 clathrin assembly protein AP19, small subunit [Acanthamoeba castellanii str. Neff]
MNAQGKTRLDKWFTPHGSKERRRVKREMETTILRRGRNTSNFIQWKEFTVIYRRYASLFFVFCVDTADNELIVLEAIHLLVRAMDKYFGNVCELDLIFNFDKAYQILDEVLMAGELQETSLNKITHIVHEQDLLENPQMNNSEFSIF